MRKSKYDKLCEGIEHTTSAPDFFEFIWKCLAGVNHSMPFYVDIRDNQPVVICFTFLFPLDDRSAEVILTAGKSKGYFSKVKEVRFIGSKIRKETALEFKTINDSVSVYWVTFDEYINHHEEWKKNIYSHFYADPLFWTTNMKASGFLPV